MPPFTLSEDAWPGSLPTLHREFLRRAVDDLSRDPRLVGVAAGGSFRTNSLDAYSDLDLVVVVDPDAWPAILGEREAIVRPLGSLLAAFTGEHVGEPRLLISLYGPPLLHVDFKFVSLADLHPRVEDPVVLWERDSLVSTALSASTPAYPQPNAQWLEDRFWVWVHYLATKIGRGELFEAIDVLTFLRGRVLGPLLLAANGHTPSGVRRLEAAVPGVLDRLRGTAPIHDRAEIVAALRQTIALYRDVRPTSVRRLDDAEREAVRYLDAVAESEAKG